MIGGNNRTWLNEGNEFHLIESTANLVNYFISNTKITNNFTRWAENMIFFKSYPWLRMFILIIIYFALNVTEEK